MAHRELRAFQANGRGRPAAAGDGDGLTPLEVLLGVMRHHYRAGDLAAAAAVAKDAAPYCHPRLTSAEVSGARGAQVRLLGS
jgi:hypothetical protein